VLVCCCSPHRATPRVQITNQAGDACGDFRRECELVADLAVVLETSHLQGDIRKLDSKSELSVLLIDKCRLGATMILASGSEDHVKRLDRAFWADYRCELESLFQQDEVVIALSATRRFSPGKVKSCGRRPAFRSTDAAHGPPMLRLFSIEGPWPTPWVDRVLPVVTELARRSLAMASFRS